MPFCDFIYSRNVSAVAVRLVQLVMLRLRGFLFSHSIKKLSKQTGKAANECKWISFSGLRVFAVIRVQLCETENPLWSLAWQLEKMSEKAIISGYFDRVIARFSAITMFAAQATIIHHWTWIIRYFTNVTCCDFIRTVRLKFWSQSIRRMKNSFSHRFNSWF